jgi:hypothetical protein
MMFHAPESLKQRVSGCPELLVRPCLKANSKNESVVPILPKVTKALPVSFDRRQTLGWG